MDAKELKLGNMINFRNREGLNQGHIVGIHKKRCTIKNERGTRESKYFHMEPIPLTEEWLTRMGFYKLNWDDFHEEEFDWIYSLHKDNDIDLEVGQLVDKSEYKFNVFLWSGNSLNHIKYVHQLQNLYFSLIGKELIIKSNG